MPGPSNLYGVANAPAYAFNMSNTAGDIACPAGTYTTVCSSPPIIMPTSGYFFPIIFGQWVIQMLATSPSGLQLGFNINGGSVVDLSQVDAINLVANSRQEWFPTLLGTPSNTLWRAPGAVINMVVQPNNQGVNWASFASRYTVMMMRAQDQ